uniref:Ig-like domain-containing protein n=1 Tax=Gopherus agassizii TaxID=38772 RepID=A0A452HL10_9SAUR
MKAPDILLWTLTAFLSLGFSQGQGSVTQTQGQLEKLKGQTVTLECTFSTGYQYYYLFWYRQQRSGTMDFLFRISQSNAEKNGAGRRFSAEFRKSSNFCSLTIKELEPTDSAMYFCALMEHIVRSLIGSPVQKPTPLTFSSPLTTAEFNPEDTDRWLNQMVGLV